MHTIFKLHASSRAAKLASMETHRRERSSLKVDPGGRYYSLPKQSTPTPVQPRRLPPRRYPRATHLCRGRTRALRGDGSLGAHHLQQIRVHIVLICQARQQSMAIDRRHTTPKLILRQKATTDGVSARRSTSHTERGLNVLVRPKGRVLRARHRARAARLPNSKRARKSVPASLPTDGVVAEPLPLLRVYGHILTIPPTTRPRWVYDTLGEAYAARRR
jgi:hypothetical protein